MGIESNSASGEVTLEDVLQKIKPYGRFNLYCFVLILFPVFLSGIYASVYNFEAMDIKYRCRVKECKDSDYFSMNHEEYLNFTIPHNGKSYEKCFRYAPTNSTDESEFACESKNFDETNVTSCNDFVYADENYTIAKEFNLGCQDWKRTIIGTIHNSGFFISIPLTGIISDRYGRRFALTLACVTAGIFGIVRSLSTTYTMFAIFEFLESALGGGCFIACFVLAMELVGPKERVFVSLLLNLCYSFGGIAVALSAWWLQNWRSLLLFIYTPALLLVFYLWILNESFRWLLSKGRNLEAIEVLKKASRVNKADIPQEHLDQIEKHANIQTSNAINDSEKTSEFKQLWKSPMIWKRTALCSFLWMSSTLAYYGLSINAIALSGNSYLNYVVVISVEVPANIVQLLLLDRFGRKKVVSLAFLLSGVVLISYGFIPDGAWPLVFYLSGKLLITVAYNCLYVFVAEVFPTVYRTSLLALCSTVGRVGSVLAPQVPLLTKYYEHFPTALFGTIAIFSCLLVSQLPETNNQKLPDTLKEASDLDKNKS